MEGVAIRVRTLPVPLLAIVEVALLCRVTTKRVLIRMNASTITVDVNSCVLTSMHRSIVNVNLVINYRKMENLAAILMNATGILDAPTYVIIPLDHINVAVDQGISLVQMEPHVKISTTVLE